MKASELAAYLQTVIDEHGDREIYVYDRSDYEHYPIDEGTISVAETKNHPVKGYEHIQCRVDQRWLGRAQSKFDKQPTNKILTIIGRRY